MFRVPGSVLVAALALGGSGAADRPPRPASWTEGEMFDEGWVISLGEEAPDFELADADGALHRLSDFAGRPVVLVFWGSW